MSPRPDTRPITSSVSDLRAVVPAARVTGNAEITGITIDSRDVRPGDLFAALRGSDFDGHAFIEQAIEKGAAAILAEELPEDVDHPAIIVENSRRDLALISAEFYSHPSKELLTIGLTGTDGKTTTTALVQWILRENGIQTGGIGTLGVQIGDGTTISIGHQSTPESHLVQGFLRQMVDAGTEAVVIEATSHGLDMFRLDSTQFTIAGVTNITSEHLEYHKTVEAYRAAKGLLIQRVAAVAGTVILNADDEGAMSLASLAAGSTLRTYAIFDQSSDLIATNVVADDSGCEFGLSVDGETLPVSIPMLGEFNVANSLCAIAVAQAAGIGVKESIQALSNAPGVHGRMQVIDEGQPFRVVVDYAHTPASLEKALGLLRSLMADGKLIVVSGSAGERDTVKRPQQGKVMSDIADIVIITSEDPRKEDPMQIIREIAAGVENRQADVRQIEDRREAIALAFSLAAPGDMVLLAGKGHETSIIWGREHRPWDEAAVASELLTPYTMR